MVFQAESNQAHFLHKLTTLEAALAEHKLITDRLEVVEKHGFYWTLLCILGPFLSVCCIDVFSHVRVNNVAQGILNYCGANAAFIDEATVKRIKENLLQPLQNKVLGKYSVSDAVEELDELPPTLPLVWPQDISRLGITDVQKNELDAILSEVAPLAFGSRFRTGSSYSLSFEKTNTRGRTLQLFSYRTGETKKFQLPLTVTIVKRKPQRLNSFLLWTKQVVAEGGERRVRLAYDLMKGEFRALKRCESEIEELVLRHFRSYPSPGIERVIQFYNPQKSDHGVSIKKQHLVEPLFEGTLSSLYLQIKEQKDILSVMRQLLTGLTALHDFTPKTISVSSDPRELDTITTTTTTYPKAFHLDIKPHNILLRRLPSGEWDARLIDFGLVNTFFPGNGTPGYRPPEDMRLLCEVQPEGPEGSRSPDISGQQIVEKTASYNQKKDVWQLGLTFTTLLTQHLGNLKKEKILVIIPPLQCIENAFRKGEKNGHLDGHIADLTQEEVDADLAELKAETPADYAPLWNELISKMLQVDPMQRFSSKEALERLSSLMPGAPTPPTPFTWGSSF
jgi:serine/threonine protein kinase